MGHLKKENVERCFTLVREYLEGAPKSKRQETAVLALHQLRDVTAGVESGKVGDDLEWGCHSKPLVDISQGIG